MRGAVLLDPKTGRPENEAARDRRLADIQELIELARVHPEIRGFLADTSITIPDAPSGLEHALVTVAGKVHPVAMIANPDGHVYGSIPTYSAFSGSLAAAANKPFLHVFNAAGSGKVVKLRKVFIQPAAGTVNALTPQTWRVARTNSIGGTGNTAITIQKHDPNSANVAAQITAAHSFTAGGTQTFTYFELPIDVEETRLGVYNQAFWNILPVDGDETEDYVIREGQGIVIQNVTGGTFNYSVLGVFSIV